MDIIFFTSNVNKNGRVEITKTMIYESNPLFCRLFQPGFTVQSTAFLGLVEYLLITLLATSKNRKQSLLK